MRRYGWALAVALVAACVTLLPVHLGQRGRIHRIEREAHEARVRVDRLGPIIAEVDALAAARQELELRSRLLRPDSSRSPIAPALLEELAEQCHTGAIDLESLRIRGGFMELTGHAASRRAVNLPGMRLEEQGLIAEYDVRRLEAAAEGRASFTLVADLPQTGKKRRR